jgi:hypothetical protein
MRGSLALLCAFAILLCAQSFAASTTNTGASYAGASNCTNSGAHSGILGYFLKIFGAGAAHNCGPAANGTRLFPPVNASAAEQTNGTVILGVVQKSMSLALGSNASYAGRLHLVPSGFIGALISIDTPIRIDWNTGKNASVYVNATSLPFVGSLVFALSNGTNGAALCTNFNLTAVSDQNYLAALGSHSKSLQCSTPGSKYGAYLYDFRNANPSSLQQYGIDVNYTAMYPSSYNGEGCTYVYGNVTQPSTGGKGQLYTCISSASGMPLTLNMSLKSSQAAISLLLNET